MLVADLRCRWQVVQFGLGMVRLHQKSNLTNWIAAGAMVIGLSA
jgi:hypothetical protein